MQHVVVDGVIRAGEVVGDQYKLVRGDAVHRAAAGLGTIPAVLNRLDEPGQIVLCGATTAEAHLLRRDQAAQLAEVGQTGRHHAFGELGDAAC